MRDAIEAGDADALGARLRDAFESKMRMNPSITEHTRVERMLELARETGAPALFGYVMDSDCVVVEAAAPQSGAWTTCLARTAMAGYLAAGAEDLTLEDYFLEPGDAAERAVAWAAEAGREVNAESVVDVLTADADPLAENIFFRLLDRLGLGHGNLFFGRTSIGGSRHAGRRQHIAGLHPAGWSAARQARQVHRLFAGQSPGGGRSVHLAGNAGPRRNLHVPGRHLAARDLLHERIDFEGGGYDHRAGAPAFGHPPHDAAGFREIFGISEFFAPRFACGTGRPRVHFRPKQ